MPASLLEDDQQPSLVEALFAASRHWGISLHFNKGLAGAPAADRAAARETAMNPVAADAFALAFVIASGPPAFPNLPTREADLPSARRDAEAVRRASGEVSKLVPTPASYLSESDFFIGEWREAFWGPNYPRLVAVKRKYDPTGLFIAHHGVGSEEWEADGFAGRADENAG